MHRRLPCDLGRVRVAILYSLAYDHAPGRPEDRLADEETAWVAREVAQALEHHAASVRMLPIAEGLPAILSQLDPRRHLVFNLCEALPGIQRPESYAAQMLTRYGFIFTGADARALSLSEDKARAKRLLATAGVRTPAFQIVSTVKNWSPDIPLPAIVKPASQNGSIGITQRSLARSPEELRSRVAECLQTYGPPVLVEEYIAGREINVAIWGSRRPEVLPPYEIDFRWTDDPLQQFLTFDSKWVPDSPEYLGTPGICPADLSQEIWQQVKELALKAHQTLGCPAVARVDMRLRQGIPYVLEVNANPDLAPDAGFAATARAAGYTYEQMILRVARLALENQP